MFTDLWTKNDFFKSNFPRNADIHGFMDKKRFFQNDLKKRAYHPKC